MSLIILSKICLTNDECKNDGKLLTWNASYYRYFEKTYFVDQISQKTCHLNFIRKKSTPINFEQTEIEPISAIFRIYYLI